MIIDGRKIADQILATLPKNSGKRIAFISFVHDPRSRAFMNVKIAVGKELGIEATIVEKNAPTTDEAIAVVQETSEAYDAVIIQLPLPPHLDVQKIVNEVPIEKDIDLLSEAAFLSFQTGETNRMPPVAAAVWEVVYQKNIDIGILQNNKIVILGKGKLVGESVAALFDREKFPYKAFDRSTDIETLTHELRDADIVIAGIGKPHFVKPNMVKDGLVLIDCGTSESERKLRGDIDPACADKASLFTPVPGGIGPITVACLYRNLFLE